jgi:hypothetical protein
VSTAAHSQRATSALSAHERTLLHDGWGTRPAPPADALDPIEATIHAYDELIRTGLTTRQAAGILDVDISRVLQRLRQHTLYGLKAGRDWILPAFQFAVGRELPGLAQVLPRASTTIHPVALTQWFELPNNDLRLRGRCVSPIDWLRSGGRPTRVADLIADLNDI